MYDYIFLLCTCRCKTLFDCKKYYIHKRFTYLYYSLYVFRMIYNLENKKDANKTLNVKECLNF